MTTTDTAAIDTALAAGEARLKTGAFAEALPLLEEARAAALAAEESGRHAQALKLLGDYWRYQSNPYQAGALYEEVLQAAAKLGDRRLLAEVQLAYGRLKMPQGQQDNAWNLFEAAGQIFQELGEAGLEGQTIGGRGDVAGHRGDTATAKALYEEALVKCEAAGDHLGQAHTLKSLGRLIQQTDGAEAALSVLKRSIDAYQASGFRYGEAFTWQYYAQVLGQEHRLPEAAEALGQAAQLFEQLELPAQAGRMREFQRQVQEAMGT